MPFIPDDILGEALKGEAEELQVLLGYAMVYQNEGEEPEASRLAALARLSPDLIQDILSSLSSKGWLEKVKDYRE